MDRANASLVTIKGPQVTEFTIKNLSVFTQVLYCTVVCCAVLYCTDFTQYLVSLEVRNPEGGGPATTVVVMTDEGVPRSVVQLLQIFLGSYTNIFQRPAERVDPLHHEQLGGGHLGGAQAAQWGH